MVRRGSSQIAILGSDVLTAAIGYRVITPPQKRTSPWSIDLNAARYDQAACTTCTPARRRHSPQMWGPR